MKNPTQGQIILAKETTPQAYDDILGKFRDEFVRKVEQAIVYHEGNVLTGQTATFYRAGVVDSVNANPPGYSDFLDGYWWKKGGNDIILTDVFSTLALNLPDDGQVPDQTGAEIFGQISYFDVNNGNPIVPGDESKNKANSVASHIMMHTYAMSRVRLCTVLNRMAITNKKWVSTSWPATFEGQYTVQAKGDTLVQFPELYEFSNLNTFSGITHMSDPWYSATLFQVFSRTLVGDILRGPRLDPNGAGGGPDPYGELIAADTLIRLFDEMKRVWFQAKDITAKAVIDFCHTSCHASCHSSRSRR